MLSKESHRHFFNFLTCRTVNFKKSKGALYDFACGLQKFCLNREPEQFEFFRFLVDGSHWSSKRKFKKADKQQAGHLGCGSGYNFNSYKPYTKSENCTNSQSREQMHSVLDKLAKSLRQKSYHNFCRYMNAFFAVRNLDVMGEIVKPK